MKKMIWKIWKDLYDFSAKPTGRVCLTAQKSYKSEQIEQIDIDEKIFGRFVGFLGAAD